MFRLTWILLVSCITLHQVGGEFGPPEYCKMPAGPKNCVVSYSRFNRYYPRYEFNWDMQECFKIHWANTCPLPSTAANNFETYDDCKDVCGGYAKK